MVWFRVDDGFCDHPKVEELLSGRHAGDAIALWTLAGAWCARQLTDGAITSAKVARLGIPKHAQGAAELVRVGLWETTETGYRFHDWSEMQPLREDVTSRRAAVAARQRKHRHASVTPHVTRDMPVTDAVTDAVSHAPVTASVTPLLARAFPVPSRPDPTQEERERAPARSRGLSDPGQSFTLDEVLGAPERPPSQQPLAIVTRCYARAYEAARNVAWMSHGKHTSDLVTIAEWAEVQARRDSKTTEAVVLEVLRAAFADPWLASKGFPLGTIAKQAGELYRPPPKAAAAGPPAVLNTYLLRHLNDEITNLNARRNPNAPKSAAAIDAQIAELNARIRAENADPTGVADAPSRSRS